MTESADNKLKGLHEVLDHLHNDQKKTWPEFSIGDTVRVHYKIVEGNKERIQVYEGTVISISGEGFHKTFIVRRVAHEVGVERIFPFHSPAIAKLEVTRKGKVRRAKLYYLRDKSGKEGRIKEARDSQATINASQKKTKKKKVKAKKEEAAPVAEVETPAPAAPVAETPEPVAAGTEEKSAE